MVSRPLLTTDLDSVLENAEAAFRELRGARLFLTGGTGFFGHSLLESLLYANAKLDLRITASVLTRSSAGFRKRSPHLVSDDAISVLEGDIRRFQLPAEAYTHVVHAATDSVVQPGGPAQDLAETIVEGTRRVLQFARQAGAVRLLYVSSGAVYGRGITDIAHIPETYCGSADLQQPRSAYDESKRRAEQLCVTYSQGTELECSVARCFAFVGPHLPLDRHFAIGNFIRDAIAGTPIRIQGDGTPLRSYMYTSDLAAWLWTMLVRGPANRPYNVGSDAAISISQLAHLVAQTLRPSLEVSVAGKAAGETLRSTYVPDISRARNELGLDVTIDLASAIRRTAAWHGFAAI